MMYNKKLIVLIGNIGSGKTTLAKKYVKKGYVVIARDDLRYLIGGGKYIFDKNLEPAIWASEHNIIENFMRTNINIIVDEVGILKNTRGIYINLADKYNYHIAAIILPKLSMKESVDRRMKNPHGQNDRKLWEQIWTNFNMNYENPSFLEGFDIIQEKGE